MSNGSNLVQSALTLLVVGVVMGSAATYKVTEDDRSDHAPASVTEAARLYDKKFDDVCDAEFARAYKGMMTKRAYKDEPVDESIAIPSSKFDGYVHVFVATPEGVCL